MVNARSSLISNPSFLFPLRLFSSFIIYIYFFIFFFPLHRWDACINTCRIASQISGETPHWNFFLVVTESKGIVLLLQLFGIIIPSRYVWAISRRFYVLQPWPRLLRANSLLFEEANISISTTCTWIFSLLSFPQDWSWYWSKTMRPTNAINLPLEKSGNYSYVFFNWI